jgi:hypothetical protein
MKNFYKALDHYRKLFREGDSHISFVKEDKIYWLIDNRCVHKIPENEMELNPAIFKPFPGNLAEIIQKAEAGTDLFQTGLVKYQKNREAIIPFVSKGDTPFTIWFNKSLFDTFPSEISLKGTSPIEPAAVQDHGVTIGIILPVRNDRDDITLFA